MAKKKTARKKASAKRGAPKRKAAKRKSVRRVGHTPKGYHSVTPYFVVAHANDALNFYKESFGAKVILVLRDPTGRVGHAELKFGDSIVMMADEHPNMGIFAPKPGESVPVHLHFSVKDVDAFVAKAVKGGAKITRPVADQFYGMRTAMLTDPFGHSWSIATQFEEVPPKVLLKRWNAMMSERPKGD